MLFCLVLNTGVKLQLVTEGFFFMYVCVFCGMSSACVSRSVIFLQSDIGIFSAKQCIGHSRDEREKLLNHT